MARQKILLSWSSGKDSAWSLHVLRQRGDYDIAGLLTTINAAADRVAMHAVRRELLELQAQSAGLPLIEIPLPWPCSNANYERLMAEACMTAVAQGIRGIAFGDLFLEEVRAYRERQLQPAGMGAIFPLWGFPTATLAREMIAGGLRARITCVDPKLLDGSFAGREFDDALLGDLEEHSAARARRVDAASSIDAYSADACGADSRGVDACGENGEFHTFCYAGPMFGEPIHVRTGETVERDGFVFTDLTP